MKINNMLRLALIVSLPFVAEFSHALETPAAKLAAPDEIETFMRKHDANGDSKISKDEATAAGISDQKFNQADSGKDGYIDRKELQVADGIGLCC